MEETKEELKEEPKVCTERCVKCNHFQVLMGNYCSLSNGFCNYIIHKGKRRPCLPGDECTEFEPRRRNYARSAEYI